MARKRCHITITINFSSKIFYSTAELHTYGDIKLLYEIHDTHNLQSCFYQASWRPTVLFVQIYFPWDIFLGEHCSVILLMMLSSPW
jgi:hypothetical protein